MLYGTRFGLFQIFQSDNLLRSFSQLKEGIWLSKDYLRAVEISK